jgi:hypothetical protein
MDLIIKIVIAVLIALVVTGLLNFFDLFNASLNGLLGVLAGLFYFFGDRFNR